MWKIVEFVETRGNPVETAWQAWETVETDEF